MASVIDSPSSRARRISPASERALFHLPVEAFKRPIPAVPVHCFAAERDQALAAGQPTGIIPLDQSRALDLPWAATTPTMLARYLVVRAGERLGHCFTSTGETYYVVRGNGRSTGHGESIEWREGDAFCLAGGAPIEHEAEGEAVLLLTTDEPLLAYFHAGYDPVTDPWRIEPTLFAGEAVRQQLADMRAEEDLTRAAGKAVILITGGMRHRQCATRSLSMTFNSLEAAADQRAHKHSSAALTLCIHPDRVHSLVGEERVDWSHGLLLVTPPGAVHSHHNRGGETMLSFVIQDSPVHAQLRTSSFSFID